MKFISFTLKIKPFTSDYLNADIKKWGLNMRRKILIIVSRVMRIVIVSCVIALVFNSLSPKGIPLITRYRKITIRGNEIKVPIFIVNSDRNFDSKNRQFGFVMHPAEEINLKDAFKCFANGTAIFIDTRTSDRYRLGHIPGAISLPIEELSFEEFSLENLGLDQKIVTYCDGEECSESIDLALYLEEIGFSNIYFFMSGWQEWKNAGYQISEGDKP